MYHKKGNTGRPNHPHHEYVCSSYRHYFRSCTCHNIRVSVIEEWTLTAIRRVSGYVQENEAEFTRRVREKSELQQENHFSELLTGYDTGQKSLLNEFVEKVIVHEATKTNGVREQEVEIYLNFIGKFDLPEQEGQPEEMPVRKSRKKLRRDMTEEELARAREIDHIRYAKKVAAKKAVEEAQRAAILQGTPLRNQAAGKRSS